jgi:hypothetical protein
LPAEGRKGPPPKWPSGHKPSDAERKAWRRLWALPQAVAWQDMPGCAELVERYVRVSCATAADLDDGTVKAATLAQLARMEGDLGLTPAALARLRWKVEGRLPAVTAGEPQPVPVPIVRRMRAVDPAPRIGE